MVVGHQWGGPFRDVGAPLAFLKKELRNSFRREKDDSEKKTPSTEAISDQRSWVAPALLRPRARPSIAGTGHVVGIWDVCR